MACEDLTHRPSSSGPADDQYSAKTPVNNPNAVVPNTTVKKMPNTGGPPYLAAGAMLLLGAAVVAGRSVLSRGSEMLLETVEEAPEGAEPRSATGGAQETRGRRWWEFWR